MKPILRPLKVVILALALSIGISYVSAWTTPTATPPSSNVAAPINVSSTAQTKTGDISAWNLISNAVATNNVVSTAVVTNSLVGNTVATNNLAVPTGAAAGRVLTSDAAGNATWKAAGGITGGSCATNQIMTGINTNGTPICSTSTAIGATCTYGNYSGVVMSNSSGTHCCAVPSYDNGNIWSNYLVNCYAF